MVQAASKQAQPCAHRINRTWIADKIEANNVVSASTGMTTTARNRMITLYGSRNPILGPEGEQMANRLWRIGACQAQFQANLGHPTNIRTGINPHDQPGKGRFVDTAKGGLPVDRGRSRRNHRIALERYKDIAQIGVRVV